MGPSLLFQYLHSNFITQVCLAYWLWITAAAAPYIAPYQWHKTSRVLQSHTQKFHPSQHLTCTHNMPQIWGPCHVSHFLLQSPLCPTFMLLSETATSTHALHGYCKVLSPDPKTQPSRCQHWGPWSPQSIGVRPASTTWTPRDTTLNLVTQILPKIIPLGIFPLSQAQTRVLLSLLTWSSTEAPLTIYSGEWTSESCLPSWLIRCAWKYSNLVGVEFRFKQGIPLVPFKILHKIFSISD